MEAIGKNLVLGAVRGYTFEQLRPFVVSLRRSGFSGDLVLLWNTLSLETLAALGAHGVKLVPFRYRGSGTLNSWSRFWPWLSRLLPLLGNSWVAREILKAILPLQTVRFLHYHDYISAHCGDYDKVFITDVRDVFFQTDPFAGFEAGVGVFEEGDVRLIGEEREYNARWVEELFGRHEMERIAGYPVLCSGTIIGETGAILNYFERFEALLREARKVETGGSDQGVHNYLCRVVAPESVSVCKNGRTQVLTMGPQLKLGEDFKISSNGAICVSNGAPVPVLHQYDRHPALEALFRQSVAE